MQRIESGGKIDSKLAQLEETESNDWKAIAIKVLQSAVLVLCFLWFTLLT